MEELSHMTVSAYIFFDVKLGHTQDVLDQLRTISCITKVAVVTGEWDIVARIEVESLEELYQITSEKIHMIEGILDTQTAVIEKEIIGE